MVAPLSIFGASISNVATSMLMFAAKTDICSFKTLFWLQRNHKSLAFIPLLLLQTLRSSPSLFHTFFILSVC